MSRRRPASTWARDRITEFERPAIGEAAQPDVADRVVGIGRALDLLLEDDVARDRDIEGDAAVAHDLERHDRAARSADPVPGAVHREPVERHAVGAEHEVPRPQAGRLGRRSGDRGDDDEPTVRSERRAALVAVRVLGRDLRPDTLELPADPLQTLAVLGRREVRGVRVAECLDHAADRALDDRRPVDLPARVALRDGLVGVPERTEVVVLADRRPGLEDGLAAHRVAGHEQGGPAHDRHECHGDGQDGQAAGPRRSRAGGGHGLERGHALRRGGRGSRVVIEGSHRGSSGASNRER